MNAGALDPMATCKKFLQVRPNPGGPSAAPLVRGVPVVKNFLTTALGAARRGSGSIKFGLMLAQISVLPGRAIDAECFWELEALEEQIKLESDQ